METGAVPAAVAYRQGAPAPEVVRVGILGCARIAPAALVRPARRVAGVSVVAIGSRRLERARRWASRHRIPRAYGSYEQVLADPDVDAVYVPLPNGLHAEWTIRALEAGKHVLCEKPLAGSEQEARTMAAAARRTGLVAMEALHYRHHPLFARIARVVASGELGELRRVESSLGFPLVRRSDVRWDPGLAGGAAMDVGCYPISAVMALAPGEPEVLTASGAVTRRGVDRSFRATLGFPKGVEGVVSGSLFGPPQSRLEVTGTRGRLSVLNPFMPHRLYRMRVVVDGTERREHVSGHATYTHQLAAFVAAVREGTPVTTDFDDAVRTLRVLDTIRTLVGVPVPGSRR